MNYKELTFGELLVLKKDLSNINNIITLQLTLAFIEKLYEDGIIEEGQAKQMIKAVKDKSVNANGYDIESTGNIKIIAEVKCNLPIHGKLGAQQRENLYKDVGNLLDGKNGKDPSDYVKILVVFDADPSNSVVYNTLKNHFNDKISEYEGKKSTRTDVVYVVTLTTEEIEALLVRMKENFT